ncbi:unnamed protein product [Symbiodinium natans]|uniref:Non-haem dioxygenase N-terminal domain-containing protein n=1 Tax=Symbiodinium natans TaxID=878477 RepID=A0A812TH62_9DINO|nr:unnamed protein product [Symbiodinium natans]
MAAASPKMDELVILDYQALVDGKDHKAEVARAFGPGGLGICGVRGVPGLQELRKKLLPLSRRLAQLPKDVLEKYERADAHYCVGWSHGREKFKGKADLAKGSFFANPLWDDPAEGNEEVRTKYPFAASLGVSLQLEPKEPTLGILTSPVPLGSRVSSSSQDQPMVQQQFDVAAAIDHFFGVNAGKLLYQSVASELGFSASLVQPASGTRTIGALRLLRGPFSKMIATFLLLCMHGYPGRARNAGRTASLQCHLVKLCRNCPD